jgi:hypothetical protein
MTTAFVLGNGVSRQPINLLSLKSHGKIYGCNALYREFTPDVLVATDTPIARSIQHSGYSLANRFYTRKPIMNSGALPIPVEYNSNSSGPTAAAIAALDLSTEVYLLGFDLGPDLNNQFNNIYAGTEFYKSAGTNPTYTGNWIRQLVSVMNDFSNIQFTRVLGTTTADIIQFNSVKNYQTITIENFQNQFNC